MHRKIYTLLALLLLVAFVFGIVVGLGDETAEATMLEESANSQSTQFASALELNARQKVLVIEDGFASPPQGLMDVDVKGCTNFAMTIVSGNARFEKGRQTASTTICSSGTLTLPTLTPGPLNDESYVDIRILAVEAGRVVGQVRVATIEQGGIDRLRALLPEDSRAYIALGDHYALIDQTLLPTDDTRAISGTLTDGHPQMKGESSSNATEGICIRPIWGPGYVEWAMSDPAGAGYSVKPEEGNDLVWGQAPSQAIDGVYRQSWGCCTALKVPDSCTVTIYEDGSIYWCCNATAYYLGYRVTWVNPCDNNSPEGGWPDCPLW